MELNKISRRLGELEEIQLTIHAHPSQKMKALDYANSQLPEIMSVIVEDDSLSPTIFYVVDPRFANVRQVAT